MNQRGLINLNLRQLEFFKNLAEIEQMTQTAERLNTTQPNLSHALNKLEEELGVKLFDRVGRNIRLTKYGAIYYEYVAQALTLLEHGERELKELISPEKGQVNFAFTYTMGPLVAPTLITEFRQIPGNQDIAFNLSQNNSSTIMKLLSNQEIDLALCSKMEDHPHVSFEKIVQEDIVLIVAIDHPLAHLTSISLEETSPYPFVYFNRASGLRTYIDGILNHVGVTPIIALEVEEDHTMVGFVSFGYGIALIPRIAGLESYAVKIIEIKNFSSHRYLYLAHLKDSYLSPAVLNFKNFILNYAHTYLLPEED